jgi:hypothetical protein
MACGIVGTPAATVDHCAARARLLKASTTRLVQVICPSGGFLTGLSSLISDFPKNISVPTHPKSPLELFVSHPRRGAYHDRHERGVGCGGRGSVLRAMGSQGGFSGIRERFPGALTRDAFRGRQNRVVLTPRRWRQVRGALLAQPGSDKTSLCGRRWQKSPVTGESTT